MTTTTALLAPGGSAHHLGIFDGFTWGNGTTIMAAAIAAFIAVVGYSRQRKAERRAERATLYGNAIAAVENYLEGPYRIHRKDGSKETRFAITSATSDAKSAISLHQALLEMHAPPEVCAAYYAFVDAAIAEAGPQMTAAWMVNAITTDDQVPLGVGYARTDSDAKRATLVTTMKVDLTRLT